MKDTCSSSKQVCQFRKILARISHMGKRTGQSREGTRATTTIRARSLQPSSPPMSRAWHSTLRRLIILGSPDTDSTGSAMSGKDKSWAGALKPSVSWEPSATPGLGLHRLVGVSEHLTTHTVQILHRLRVVSWGRCLCHKAGHHQGSAGEATEDQQVDCLNTVAREAIEGHCCSLPSMR